MKEFHRKQRRARLIWINDGKPRGNNYKSYSDYKKAKYDFRKQQRAAKRKWEGDRYEDIRHNAELDVNEFYKITKRQKLKNSSNSSSKLEYNGTVTVSPESTCNLWQTYFSDIYSEFESDEFDTTFYDNINNKFISLLEKETSEISSDVNTITFDEIKTQIKSLKRRKAPGPDNVMNEHLIHGGEMIVKCLCNLFNSMLSCEYVPQGLKHGLIIPLHKGNNKSKSDPNNYRAITLTSSIGKLYEKIILSRIENTLEENGTIFPHKCQFGFRKGYGTIPAIFTIKELINYYINNGSDILACFLDNAKAFDRIWQNGLLVKLYDIGVTGKIWKIIVQTYKGATAQIKYCNFLSDKFQIKQGVGQGRVMSSWMFSLFIDGLMYALDELNLGIMIGNIRISSLLLADDTTLLAASAKSMQSLLDCVNQYANKWRLTYNAKKSTGVIFQSKKKDIHNISFMLGNLQIAISNDVLYLGTVINAQCNAKGSIDKSCKKLRYSMFTLKDVGIKPYGMAPCSIKRIYERVVLPGVLYGSETWGHLSNNDIQTLDLNERKFVRYILNLECTSPTDATPSTLGLWTFSGYVDKYKLLFLGRLCTSSPSFIFKEIFCYLISYVSMFVDQINFLTVDLINTCNLYGLSQYIEKFVTDGTFPSKLEWSKQVKLAVNRKQEQDWLENVQNRPELSRYRKIHSTLTEHRGLRLISNDSKRKYQYLILVKLSTIPIKSAHCSLCDTVAADIIKHLIMNCKHLLERRNIMFYEIVDLLPVQDSVNFFNYDDDCILEFLLCGNTIDFMDNDTWIQIIQKTSYHIMLMYNVFKDVLKNNVFNFLR